MVKRPSVCLVTCYKDPNYIRVKTLETALVANKVRLIIVRNKKRGVLRYIEVIFKLIKTRLTINPDVYLVTFRGYEILPIVLLVGIRKKVVFDEFINLVEWLSYEHQKVDHKSIIGRWVFAIYRFLLKSTTKIVTDTDSHAKYSANLMGLPLTKYQTIPVGTDEQTFTGNIKSPVKSDKFQVLYYGSMLPLHGVKYVLKAAEQFKQYGDIELLLVGGNEKLKSDIDQAITNGAHIEYKKWIPYDKLPATIAAADVCLGGPFGDTTQSQFVITGKTIQFLRMGKPVIIGKNKETSVFDDKKNAIIVNQANSKSLSEAIIWLYKNRAKAKRISESGNRLYDKYFSSEVIAKKVAKLIENL